uniref:PHD-type domain-containing protein n=1 Tax=Plectus sambesii TaxID=2011161 RepID=A0A914VNP7_9BILA
MSARTATPAVVSVYDHENGLLDQIEALTAPPAFNGKGPTYKKTGGGRGRCQPLQRWKSVNSQYCNACREGGELLCCDRCPASFHLLCHEPPINPQHIPTGKWLCNRCCSCPEVGQPENETAEEPPLAKAASKV